MKMPFIVAQRSSPALGRHYWLWVMALVLLGLSLWTPYLTFPLDADAAGYATAAYWWAQGDTLYRNVTITRPQGIFVIFRLIAALHLDSAIGNHLVAALYAAACTLLFLTLTQRIWGRKISFVGTTLFTVLLAAPFTEGYSTNAELFMLLPILGALYTLWSFSDDAFHHRSSLGWLLLCGLLQAVAILIKPSAAPFALMSIGWLYYRWRVQQLPQSRLWYSAAALGVGYSLGLLPALIHGLLTVSDMYLSAIIFYRIGYDSAFAGTFAYQMSSLISTTALLLVQLPILLAALISLYPGRVWRNDPTHIFLGYWFLAAFAGIAMGGNWFPHYYLPILAPLALGIVLGWQRLLQGIDRQKIQRRAILAASCAYIVLPLLLSLSIFNSVTTVLPFALHNTATTPRSEVVASYLRAHSTPTDTIYVIYQWAPIYQLSQRRPATRWLYYRELQRAPGAFDEQVARISELQTAPLYIIAAQPFDAFGLDTHGALRAAISQNYVLETTIENVPLYRRR